MKEKCESCLMLQVYRTQCILRVIYYIVVWTGGIFFFFLLLRTIFQWTSILNGCWNRICIMFCLPRYGCGFKACPPAATAASLSQEIKDCWAILLDRPPSLLPRLSFPIHSTKPLNLKVVGEPDITKRTLRI